MSLELFSRRESRRYLSYPERKTSVERTRRRRSCSFDTLNCFVPKHYPRIFLDQRLRSRLFR